MKKPPTTNQTLKQTQAELAQFPQLTQDEVNHLTIVSLFFSDAAFRKALSDFSFNATYKPVTA